MQKTEDFLERMERDVKVIDTLRKVLFDLELASAMAVEVHGEKYRLNFSHQISGLKGALHILGGRDDVKLPPTTAMHLKDLWEDGKGDY